MAATLKTGTYIETVGRRKTATARIRMAEGARTEVRVNDKEAQNYFPTEKLRVTALEPFLKVSLEKPVAVTVHVRGGGIVSQAEAVRHGISRALTRLDAGFRTPLKKEGFLKRDPRAKERRKFGLKKARKRKQWSKR